MSDADRLDFNDAEKIRRLDQALELSMRTQRMAKAAWELERKEYVEDIRRYRKEIEWLRQRSWSHVVGRWFWQKFAKRERLKEMERYWL